MINLSYRYDQNSSSLEVEGMPDVSCGDSDNTIGILSSWSLKIIGSPLLEGKKEHLDDLMQVILLYSQSYISGIRRSLASKQQIVLISPYGLKHKLQLNSTQKEVKPLEIILDDSELSDLTRCLDFLRFDKRINLEWKVDSSHPFTKRYISIGSNKKRNFVPFIYSLIIFLSSCILFILLPISDDYEIREKHNQEYIYSNEN